MLTPGLMSSLQTLQEILKSGDMREARGYLDSLIETVKSVQEHELERDAVVTSRTLLTLLLKGKEVDKNEVKDCVNTINDLLTLKGLLQ